MRRLIFPVLTLAILGSSAALAEGPVQQSQVQYTVTYTAPQKAAPVTTPSTPGQTPAVQTPVVQPKISFSVPATLFVPVGQGRHPAIVFAHDGQSGVTETMKRRCEDLARQGFVVLAPQYKGDGMGKAVKNIAAVQTLMHARGFLTKHPRVEQNNIGLMGTSQGGYLSLLAAIEDAGKWRCVVQAGGAIDVPSTGTRITSRIFLQHGDMDRVVLRKHANYLNATFRKAGTTCELKEYTLLDHNFWFWEDKSYTVEEQAQADWAWDDVVVFLNRNLRNGSAGGNVK